MMTSSKRKIYVLISKKRIFFEKKLEKTYLANILFKQFCVLVVSYAIQDILLLSRWHQIYFIDGCRNRK